MFPAFALLTWRSPTKYRPGVLRVTDRVFPSPTLIAPECLCTDYKGQGCGQHGRSVTHTTCGRQRTTRRSVAAERQKRIKRHEEPVSPRQRIIEAPGTVDSRLYTCHFSLEEALRITPGARAAHRTWQGLRDHETASSMSSSAQVPRTVVRSIIFAP